LDLKAVKGPPPPEEGEELPEGHESIIDINGTMVRPGRFSNFIVYNKRY
jgi:hypothetical protein